MSKLSQFAHEGKGRDDPRLFMAMEDTRAAIFHIPSFSMVTTQRCVLVLCRLSGLGLYIYSIKNNCIYLHKGVDNTRDLRTMYTCAAIRR